MQRGQPKKDESRKRNEQFVIRLTEEEVKYLGGRRTVYDILRKSVNLPIN